ncbi:MAG TPA: choice-of-anchor Q domain-containing protein [Rudaea sp.]|nr:choice-of-anchor Q domain-containing protein [Rudaea sp.]
MPRLPRVLATTIRILLAALAGAAGVCGATARSWPGAAPCDTTLQACTDGSASGDIVQVQTNGPIAEDVLVLKPLSLVAAAGFRPVFAPGGGILLLYSAGAGVAWSTTIDGFTLLDGRVGVRTSSGDMTVTLRNLDVSATTSDFGAAVYVENFGTGSMHYDIERNRVRLNDTTGLQGIIVSSGSGSTLSGKVHDNRIVGNAPTDVGNIGLEIFGTSAAAPDTRIYSNQITGNLYVGVGVFVGGASSTLIANNLLRSTMTSGTFGVELSQGNAAGYSLDAQVFNNTIGGFGYGVFANGATIGGRISGNLLANNATYAIKQQASTLSEDHSLFFANGGPAPVLGPGSMIGDPKFMRGLDDMRLAAGSPAIDAADTTALTTLLSNASLAQIDADGLRRFKGATSLADIGAFEFGDGALVAFATAATAGTIDDALLNGNAAALPQLTQDSTPDTYVAVAYDPGLTALQYSASHFGVVDEDGTAPAAGSGYNVFVPGAGNGVLLHTTSAGNVSASPAFTRIDDAYLDGRSDAIVLATPRATPYFNHPFGVTYGFLFSTHWFLYQFDAGANSFPTGLQFDIYAQDPSLDAFVWNAPSAGPSTAIGHLLLDGEPCARIHVTNGTSDPHPIAVTYAAKRWTIFNVDGGSMPADAEFYVVIDEAATQFCRYDHLFHDGFGG